MTRELPLSHDLRHALHEGIAATFEGVQRDLADLVRVPSVSAAAFDPAHVTASARAVAALLRDAGMPQVEILSVPGGAPAVLAHRAGDGAGHVLLYAHHDVQPPGEGWSSDPFEPVIREGRMYGRGAADDKAGVMAHVGAIRALLAQASAAPGALPLPAITVFVEGEEEVGSPTFAQFLRTYGDRLAADVVVVADSANWKVGIPALTTSLRGLVDAVVQVDVLEHAVHSGMFGGPVLDATTQLVRLLATLHDDAGDVAVAGLDRVPTADLDYPEDVFRQEAGVLPGLTLSGTGSLPDRLWGKSALSIIGIDATAVDRASNTLAHTARAKISMRLAPGQDPGEAEAALLAHLQAAAPTTCRVTLHPGERGSGFLAPRGAASDLAHAAFAQAWGRESVEVGIGGSIPFIADLVTLNPDSAILITGVEDPHSRAHGADESVHLGELRKAVEAEALLLAAVGAGGLSGGVPRA